jgi:hypothetical protein
MELLVCGAPMEMHHKCTYQDLARRKAYDNQPPIVDGVEEILDTFSKEEQLSYQLLPLRFMWQFLNGLHISPINWVTKPGKKGRFCLDPTSTLLVRVIGLETICNLDPLPTIHRFSILNTGYHPTVSLL